jgi:hypothetical protein
MRCGVPFSVLVLASLGGACGGAAGPHAAPDGGAPAWVARGAPGPAELQRLLATTHDDVWRRLGPHRFRAQSTMRVSSPGSDRPDELTDEYLLEAGGGGRYHALHQNSRDLGFEHYFLNGELFVRPRYGRFVRRHPEEGEADRVRASTYGALAATGELLGRFITATSEGPVTAGGRAAVRLRLALAPTPGPAAAADAAGPRAWRATVTPSALGGTVDVDAATGVPLAASLKAEFSFRQGDRTARAELEQTSAVEPGVDPPLAAPAATPEPRRLRYHLERKQLLDGLIPPGAGGQ